MHSRFQRGLFAAALLSAPFLFSPLLTPAQEISAVKGGLQGVITDASGAAVPNARITITGDSDKRTVTADSNGDYTVGGLTPGLYTITAELEGFQTTQVKAVEVVISRLSSLNLKLNVGSVSDTVTVDANAVQIETTSTAVGENLDATFYSQVPVARNVGSLFYVAPGATNSGGTGNANPSIGGATGLENQYIIDGVNLTDIGYGGIGVFSPTYGSLGTGINLSFIQEVQVKEGALEPKYGKANGGVALIVTKTGGSAYHGALSAYVAPEQFSAEQRYADNYFNRVNTHGKIYAKPAFDAAVELGGYIPGLKNHLFFYGAFNPALNQTSFVAPAGSGLAAHGPFTNSITTYGWSGKLTLKPNDAVTFEASAFSDPSSSNFGYGVANEDTFPLYPNINAANTTLFSRWDFGSRSEVFRMNALVDPTWTVNLSATAKQSHFNEFGYDDVNLITDYSNTATDPVTGSAYGALFTAQGIGFVQNPNTHSQSFAIDTEKVVKAGRFGTHSLSVGYEFDRAIYDLFKAYSGPRYNVPLTNDIGAATNPAVAGVSTNSALRLSPATDCPLTLCPYVTKTDPTTGAQNKVPVYLYQNRGIYSSPYAYTSQNYHQVYLNDDWTIGRRVTLNGGIRWDQEQLIGVVQRYTFNDNWSPRVGINIDPFGDRKSKIFFNFARYTQALPNDAAVRELNQESDINHIDFAPAANPDGSLALNAQGTATPVFDAAHLLSGNPAAGPTAGHDIVYSGGGVPELIANGTKLNYEEEFIGGIERQVGGFVVSARYIDRRLLRIIEDMGGVSPEGANANLNQIFVIGNPSSTADYFVNEQETAYPAGGSAPAGCPKDYGQQFDSAGNDIGGACGLNPDTAGINTPDGRPDGFANPRRHYQSLEIEANKNFSHNFLLRVNYRFAKLYGNYEGLYRNDNSQSDPGISSLFDFTQGVLNELGGQFKAGYLNTDRRQVGNLYGSYVVPKTFMKNLTGGLGLRGTSGIPITQYGAHPVYDNAGEIPLGAGRGGVGRTASNYSLDLHADFPVNFSDSKRIKFTWDMFNVTNSRSLLQVDQDYALNSTTINADYLKPTDFQRAFYARGAIRFEF